MASGVDDGLLGWFWAGSGLVSAQSSSSGVIKDVHLNAARRWRRYRSGSTRASNEVLLDLFLGSGYISATENYFKQCDGFIHCFGYWEQSVGKQSVKKKNDVARMQFCPPLDTDKWMLIPLKATLWTLCTASLMRFVSHRSGSSETLEPVKTNCLNPSNTKELVFLFFNLMGNTSEVQPLGKM